MRYRTITTTIEAYCFTGNPYNDNKVPKWLLERLEDRRIIYDPQGILWVYPHGSVISLQQAHIGDYLTYDPETEMIWVEWKKDFESKYEQF